MRKSWFLFLMVCTVLLTKGQTLNQQKAQYIHQKILTLDSHTDTPLWLVREGIDFMSDNTTKPGIKVDYPRMLKGGLDAVFMAIYTPQGRIDSKGYSQAYRQALKLFQTIRLIVSRYPDKISLALLPEQVVENVERGKLSILIGVENGYPLGEDIRKVKEFYDLGARYITLCHAKNNQICGSSTDQKSKGGLTSFGKEVVREMNRLGMLVDVSHISDSAFYEVLQLSSKPVIASHSNARALCNHPRNLSDAMLKALSAKGGVVQVCLLSDYVKKFPSNRARDSALKVWEQRYPDYGSLDEQAKTQASRERSEIEQRYPRPKASVSDLVDHIDHIVKVAGIDCVGIGSDFDGGGGLSDCHDVSQMWKITAELLSRGYTEEDIRKIWGGNFLRVWKANLRGLP